MWVYFIRKQRRQQSCPVTASRHSGRVLPKQQPRKAPPGRVEFQESLLWSGCLPSLQKPWLCSGFSIQRRGRKVPAGNYINSASLPPLLHLPLLLSSAGMEQEHACYGSCSCNWDRQDGTSAPPRGAMARALASTSA